MIVPEGVHYKSNMSHVYLLTFLLLDLRLYSKMTWETAWPTRTLKGQGTGLGLLLGAHGDINVDSEQQNVMDRDIFDLGVMILGQNGCDRCCNLNFINLLKLLPFSTVCVAGNSNDNDHENPNSFYRLVTGPMTWLSGKPKSMPAASRMSRGDGIVHIKYRHQRCLTANHISTVLNFDTVTCELCECFKEVGSDHIEKNIKNCMVFENERCPRRSSEWNFSRHQLLRNTFPLDPEKKNYVRRNVRKVLFSEVLPTPFSGIIRIAGYSVDVLEQILDMDASITESRAFILFASGNQVLGGLVPLAHRYGGHQFGYWAEQLGDGRAHMLGEYVNAEGERWELQLKGSGKTPYSRQGDGRAVIRSSVREFLASEAMYYLGKSFLVATSLYIGKSARCG